jgi:hypothetical protein
MRKPPRIAVLLAILAGVGVFILRDESAPGPTKAPADARSAARDSQAAQTSDTFGEALPSREPISSSGRNPFSLQSWIEATPHKARAVAPPPPTVAPPPPLPYRFAGEFRAPTGRQVFLARGDEIFTVQQGDTLDGEYKVESLKAGELVFLHLASGTRQSLQFGAPGEETDRLAREIAKVSPDAARTLAAPLIPGLSIPRPPKGSPLANESQGAPLKQAKDDGTASKPAQFRWDGPPSAKTGTNFNVTLRMTSGTQVRSVPMQLRYDPAVLEAVAVKAGSYFGSDAGGNFGYRVNPDGSIYVGASSRTPAAASDAELLVLTFKPVRAADSAEVSVSALNLQGPAGRVIAYDSLTPFKTKITP